MFGISTKAILVIGAIALLLFGLLALQTKRVEWARAEAATARDAANANAKVVEDMKADAVRAAGIIAEREAAIADLEGRKAEIVKEIVRVPVTAQCASSPAIGAALGGLRRWTTDAPGDGGKAGARKPDGAVPAPPRSR